MLELGTQDDQNTSYIIDGSDKTFVEDVIETSKSVPVIVDFWAPWCGPCKTLGPAIEAAVTNAKGRVRLVKIDVDKNQAYADQLRVQSIPTVYAFHNGQPVDGFQGALPPSEIDAFVEKIAALHVAEDEGLGAALEAANEMMESGEYQDAIEVFKAIYEEDSSQVDAISGLMKAYIGLGEVDEAEEVLESLSGDLRNHKAIEAVIAQISLLREAETAGPIDELRTQVQADEHNHQLRFDLAVALHGSGDVKAAIDELLELFRRDREWENGAAKAQLFKIFDALPANDPMALDGRRKLSSLVFA